MAGIGPQARGRTVTMRAVGERWAPLVAEWAAATSPSAPTIAAAGQAAAASEAATTTPTAAARARWRQRRRRRWRWAATRASGSLGIESSCDDTGAAVVRGDGTVIGEVLASQAGVHEAYGGVVPRLAQQAHREAIDATVDEALRRAGVSAAELTAIAVTVGPGLSMCLEVGVRKALQLSARHRLPLLRVHHMEAHAMVTWLPPPAAAPTAAAPPPPYRRRRARHRRADAVVGAERRRHAAVPVRDAARLWRAQHARAVARRRRPPHLGLDARRFDWRGVRQDGAPARHHAGARRTAAREASARGQRARARAADADVEDARRRAACLVRLLVRWTQVGGAPAARTPAAR